MDVVFLIGRILLSLIFINSGLMGHLRAREATTAYARAYNAPAPELLVPLSGVMIIAGGLMVALGIWGDLGALLMLAFLIPTSYFMHAFWKETDPEQQQAQMIQFMKNVSIAGGALIVFYAFNQLQDEAGLSITDPLFGRG